MKIEKLHLLVTVILKDNKMKIENPLFAHLSKSESSLLTSINGELRGSEGKIALTPKISDPFWKDCVENFIHYESYSKNDNIYITMLYSLKPEFLREIFLLNKSKSKGIRDSNFFTRLIIQTFPDLSEMNRLTLMDISNHKLMFPSNFNHMDFAVYNISLLDTYLIVIPSDSEVKFLNAKNETHTEFLKRFEAYIERDVKSSANIPYNYSDFIETVFDIFIASQKGNLRTIIVTDSFRLENSEEIIIPRSALDLHKFDIKLHELEEIEKRIQELYAQKNEIRKYIDSISRQNIFKNYSDIYKVDRLSYIQSRFEILESLNIIKNDANNSIPYAIKDLVENLKISGIANDDSSYAYSIIQSQIRAYDILITHIENTLKEISLKDSYINEYIRDVISIESIWGNLKIQKILKKLNYFVIIIGVLSIFFSIYDTEIRGLFDLLKSLLMSYYSKIC